MKIRSIVFFLFYTDSKFSLSSLHRDATNDADLARSTTSSACLLPHLSRHTFVRRVYKCEHDMDARLRSIWARMERVNLSLVGLRALGWAVLGWRDVATPRHVIRSRSFRS